MTAEDYDMAFALWLKSPGMGINETDDSREGIEKFLRTNPSTCFVAEKDERLIGTILGGYDGRRGHIYHAAVSQEYLRLGIGRNLVNKLLEVFRSLGVSKSILLVYRDNEAGNSFWTALGFELTQTLNYYSLILENEDAK